MESTLSVISMFMLGTRVSSYSVFIILGISLIGYILTIIKDSKIKKKNNHIQDKTLV